MKTIYRVALRGVSIILALLFISCGQNVKKKDTGVVEEAKAVAGEEEAVMEEEKAVTGEQPAAEEPQVYDWTPRGFKEAHPLEWEVLFKTDSVRQRIGEWSEYVFKFYDKEVNKCLSKKKITKDDICSNLNISKDLVENIVKKLGEKGKVSIESDNETVIAVDFESAKMDSSTSAVEVTGSTVE